MTDLPDYACQSHQLSCKVLRDEIAQLRARVAELELALRHIAALDYTNAATNGAAYMAHEIAMREVLKPPRPAPMKL